MSSVEKAAKSREVPVIHEYAEAVLKVAEKCANENDRLFKNGDIPCRTAAHKYRAEYAKTQYERPARPLETITDKRGKYYCRGDMKGTVFDRKAMIEVSKMLRHERESVIAQSYLYK